MEKKNLFYRTIGSLIKSLALGTVKSASGMENAPKKGPYVVASNHESYIDPAVIKSYFDNRMNTIVYFLTKKEVFSSPVKKYFFENLYTIPVDRDKAGFIALEAAIQKLKEKEVIGVFPEGKRSRDNLLHKGKTGAVRMAIAARCPILPFGIENSFELWPPKNKLPRYRRQIILNFGKPYTLEKYYNKALSHDILEKLTKDLMKRIQKLSKQEMADE